MAKTIQNMINDIQTTLEGAPVVKSVQRGEATGTSDIINIKIAKVNANKCLVILEGSAESYSNYEVTPVRLKSLTDANLAVYSLRLIVSYYPFTYQVIEFY